MVYALDKFSLPEEKLPFGKTEQEEIVGRARHIVERLRKFGFRVSLDRGFLLIGDDTGRRRDVTRFVDVATVFDTIVAGLDEDPRLLDEGKDPK